MGAGRLELTCRPVFIKFKIMANYDPKLTEDMSEWLRSDHTDDESIRKGATMLLRVNRNKGLYERIIRYPKGGLKKLEYEIRKHLNIRLQGYQIEDIEKLDAEVTPQVQAAVEAADGAAEGDIPVAQESQDEGDTGCFIVKGKRPDHESLPDEIKAIWPQNAERWKKIKETYNILLALDAPCDRFEHLQLMKEAWYKYKSEMARYDDFKADSSEQGPDAGSKKPELSDADKNTVDNAQSYISRNLPALLDLVESSKDPEFTEMEKLEDLRLRIQNRVYSLIQFGVDITDQRKADLVKCDISFELPHHDAEGEGSE